MLFNLDLRIYYSLIYLGVACYICFRNPKDKRNLFLSLLSFCLGGWTFTQAFFATSTTYMSAYVWAKLTFFFSASISFPFFLFSLVFPNMHPLWKKRNLLFLASIPILIVDSFILFTDLVFTNVKPNATTLGEKADIGPFFIYVVAIILSYMLAAFMLFNFRLKKATGRERMQIIYLNISLTIWFILFIVFNGILPSFGNKAFVGLSPLLSIIFIFGFTYALIKYRLLDIELIIKRTFLYILLIVFITGLYTFTLMLPYRFIEAPGSRKSIILLVIIATIIAVTIQPLRNWLDRITDRVFHQKQYDYYSMLEKISSDITSVYKIEDVFDIVSRALIGSMHVKNMAFYLAEKGAEGAFLCQKKLGEAEQLFPEEVADDHPLIEYLTRKKGGIEAGEFRHQYGHLYSGNQVLDPVKAEIQKILDEGFQKGLLMPLLIKQNLIGFMVLGEKLSGDLYSYRDLAMLETLCHQISTTLENIRLYEQMVANERLTIIGTMAAGIAHEIRNPLASMKTFIQMLPEKYDRPDFRSRFNEIVPAEIERLSAITADLLTFAKPSNPSLTNVRIIQLVERIITLLNNQLRRKQIAIEKQVDESLELMMDEQQIFQVLLNLVLNAMQASSAGKKICIKSEVKINASLEHKELKNVAFIHIIDEGSGIKRKDFSKLFQPFFTTKAEGTGLGLATCRRIVEAHRGKILVESQENVGTKFTVVIPMHLTQDMIEKNQQPSDSSSMNDKF